jgi:hypothetical protein
MHAPLKKSYFYRLSLKIQKMLYNIPEALSFAASPRSARNRDSSRPPRRRSTSVQSRHSRQALETEEEDQNDTITSTEGPSNTVERTIEQDGQSLIAIGLQLIDSITAEQSDSENDIHQL